MVDLSDDEGGEEGGASKTKKEEPEDLGIPNVAVGFLFLFSKIHSPKKTALKTKFALVIHKRKHFLFQVGTPPPTASGNPADIECIDLE